MKIKRNALKQVQDELSILYTCRGNDKFRYCIDKNLSMLNSLNLSIQNHIKKSYAAIEAQAKEYQREANTLMLLHIEVDENNVPVMAANRQPVIKDQQAFEKEKSALEEKHKGYLQAHGEINEQMKAYLEEDVDVSFHQLFDRDIPEVLSLQDNDIINRYLKGKMMVVN